MILVVDDEPDLRAEIVDGLLGHGFQVLDAAGGQQALTILENERRIAVVLTDLVMPEMEGLTLLQRINEQRQTGIAPETILLSAAANAEDMRLAYAAGASDVLAKPVRVKQLVAALRRAISRWAERHAGDATSATP